MFRFVSNKVPLVAVSASLTRFQSSAVVGESANAANFRRYAPTRSLPKFEIHDVRDDAAQGSMTRVSVDGKQLLLSQFPQLGARKADPNDMSPQFDTERRISLRFRHVDLASLVCVVQGRLPSHHMANNAYELDFEKTPSGYVFKGQVHRVGTQTKEEWSVRFDNQFATTLEHFLDSAFTESFGFLEHQRAMTEQRNRGNNNNNNQNQNQNQNQNRNRNNNNNRNRGRNNRGNNNDAAALKSEGNAAAETN